MFNPISHQCYTDERGGPEGFKLYYNRSGLAPETCDRENPSSADNRITEELASKILELNYQMNKKRVNFQQPSDHRINITPN